MKQIKAIALAAALGLGNSVANAGFIIAPVAVSTSMGNYSDLYISHIIDQSGLQTPYTSGVTDFATYMAGPSGEMHNTGMPRTDWASALGNTTGTVDFDLGGVYTISEMAHWIYSPNWNGNIRNFTLSAGLQSDFSDAVSLGSYTALSSLSYSPYPYADEQIFQFAATDARYVRMNVLSNYGLVLTGIGEIAFDGTPAATSGNTVPEPGSLALLVIGAVGLLARRQRA